MDSTSDYYIVITATIFEDKLSTDSDSVTLEAKLKLDKARLPIEVKLFKGNIILCTRWEAIHVQIFSMQYL